MAKQEKALTRDMLVGMQVIDAEGKLLGKVEDVAFAVGKMGISLQVENEKGENRSIFWEEVQAAGDFIVLKPVTQGAIQPQQQIKPEQTQPICPTCNRPASFIKEYQRWYCYNCKKYL
jgi:sporulation protein YlmC with PRC-barrel domain